ncbi:MAG: DNA polymerase III subunit delta [Nitrospirae bacterium]|nr:DNA polymerase III subunit delta [Candidatus Troglogloeales bacterium]
MTEKSEMTYEEAQRLLRPEHLSPCYLVDGAERFFIDKILSWFLERGVDPALRDFNYNRFDGEKVGPAEILLVANSFPMAGPGRLIVVDNADKIVDLKDALLSYLNSPLKSTTVVFVAQKPDMRTKLFLNLKKQATLIHCHSLYESEIPIFIRREAEQYGIHLSEDAVLYLKEHLGKNPVLIHRELEKLSLHSGKEVGQVISLDTVEQVISGEREHTIFELLDCVCEKNLEKGLCLLSHMLSQGDPPLKVLSMFMWQFRIMALAKEALLSMPESDAGKKVPIPPYRLTAFFKRLRVWKSDEIREAFDLFREVDLQLKGSYLADAIVLERLILKLCGSIAD